MPPKIPYELARARQQREIAYQNYNRAIDENDTKEHIAQLYEIYNSFDKVCKNYYELWQEFGGSSDITSLTEALTGSSATQPSLESDKPLEVLAVLERHGIKFDWSAVAENAQAASKVLKFRIDQRMKEAQETPYWKNKKLTR